MVSDPLKPYLEFWVLVFKCYPHCPFPGKEVVRLRAQDTLKYPSHALKAAFDAYRIIPGKDFPPSAGSLIGLMDPLSTPEGLDDMANYLFEKILAIGRYGKIRESLSEFENLVLDQSPGLSSAIFNCDHRPSVVKSIRSAISRARDPAKFAEIGHNGHLIGERWRNTGETLKIDYTTDYGPEEESDV